MGTLKWIIAAIALLVAAWFVFDGSRALILGDYVTPKSGQYAGQLGPWSRMVEAVGIHPRSTLMKLIFVGYGLAWIGMILGFMTGREWAWAAMLIAAAGSLWYLPFGTVLGLVQIALLMLPAARNAAA